MNKKLLFYACVVVVLIWAINSLANAFHWYSAMWWFDIPMHIMGGMFLGLIFGALFFKKLLTLDSFERFIMILLFVLIVGIGWEFFEYFVQSVIKGSPQLANIPDSAKDMIMDLFGGTITSTFVLRRLKRYNKAHV